MRLSEFQKRILKLLDKEGAISTQLVVRRLKSPPATASRNLAKLAQAGYLQIFGKGRSVYYATVIGTRLEEVTALKNELDSYRPLPELIVEKINSILESRFIYATRTIEGAKLPLRETGLVLVGMSVRGSRDEIQDVKSQQKALKLVHDFIHSKKPFSEKFIQTIQKQITSNVMDVFLCGKYRDHEAGIAKSNKLFPTPSEVKKLMPEFVATIIRMERQKQHPIIIAAYAHYRLLEIHPFQDGNGRTARLLMNAFLLKNHYPITVIEASQRFRYYEVLQKADEGAYEIFESFIFTAIKCSLELHLGLVKP